MPKKSGAALFSVSRCSTILEKTKQTNKPFKQTNKQAQKEHWPAQPTARKAAGPHPRTRGAATALPAGGGGSLSSAGAEGLDPPAASLPIKPQALSSPQAPGGAAAHAPYSAACHSCLPGRHFFCGRVSEGSGGFQLDLAWWRGA